MIKICCRRLRQNGETIVETLVAILIAVLSCMLLSSTVVAGANINHQAQKNEDTFQQELMAAEIGADTYNDIIGGTDGSSKAYVPTTAEGETETISIKESDGSEYQYKVTYIGGDNRLTSYELNEMPTTSSEGTGGS